MRNKEIILLVKPTHECNMYCEYCYDSIEKKQIKNKIITNDLIKEIAIKACRAFETINWIWHGGEPTLAGIEFYKRNMEIIRYIASKYNTKINFSMQSNGKILSNNDLYLKVLKKLGINISFSLDYINNNEYRYAKEEFYKILSTVKTYNLPIINVVNHNEFDKIIDTYKKLESENISFMLNKRFCGNETKEQLNEIIYNYKKYIDFILWENDDIKDKTLKDFIKAIINNKGVLCTLDNCIGKFININPDGDIFPCDRYGKINSSKYGYINIKDIEFSLLEYLNSNILNNIMNDNNNFIKENCKECEVYYFCNGGCKANRITNGTIDLTIKKYNECKFLKEILSYIFDTLFNIKKEDYLKLNNEVFVEMFENNFITKEIINKL